MTQSILIPVPSIYNLLKVSLGLMGNSVETITAPDAINFGLAHLACAVGLSTGNDLRRDASAAGNDPHTLCHRLDHSPAKRIYPDDLTDGLDPA